MRVASAPVSFGIFELTTDDEGLPDPIAVLDAMVDTGYEGTELGPPGYFGDAAGTAAALAERDLGLVGSFLPLRLSRREHIAEDIAFLDEALGILDETTPPGDTRPLALISDSFCEPERMAGAGRIEELPGRLAGRRALRAAGRERAPRGRALPRPRLPAGVPLPRRHLRRDAARDRPLRRAGRPRACSASASTAGTRSSAAATRSRSSTPTASSSRHVHLKDVDGGGHAADPHAAGSASREAWRRGVFCRFGEGSVDLADGRRAPARPRLRRWVVVEQDRYLQPGQTVESLAEDARHNREVLRELGV